MVYRRDSIEAAARRKAKRDRDDASPRLRDVVPRLVSLHFEISVVQNGTVMEATRHVKRFMIDHAPALFVIDCTDTACRDGGHDVTKAVVAELTKGLERFETEDKCGGRINDRDCGRVAHVIAVATYARVARSPR